MKQPAYSLAPVVLFAFSRPYHTKQTLRALAANIFASQTDLIIYVDAARTQDEILDVDKVKIIVRSMSDFKSVTVIERETNYGLARNIIEGVTDVCKKYDRVIVLEDDIVTSPQFLQYMNQALDYFSKEPQVWHISGWNYPIDPEELGDAFFWRVMNCWGWATWSDRWIHFKKEPERLMQTWDQTKIHRFNLDGACNFWGQVNDNYEKKLNTWAVFWYATIFENSGLCLNPSVSFVKNIGHDGSGENCIQSINYDNNDLEIRHELAFPNPPGESELALIRIKNFYRSQSKPRYKKLKRKLTLFFKKVLNLNE